MHFRVFNLYEGLLLLLLLHLLTGPGPVFYLMRLFSCDVHIQLAHQRFGEHSGDLEVSEVSHFLRFCEPVIVHHGLSMILF